MSSWRSLDFLDSPRMALAYFLPLKSLPASFRPLFTEASNNYASLGFRGPKLGRETKAFNDRTGVRVSQQFYLELHVVNVLSRSF